MFFPVIAGIRENPLTDKVDCLRAHSDERDIIIPKSEGNGNQQRPDR